MFFTAYLTLIQKETDPEPEKIFTYVMGILDWVEQRNHSCIM